MKIAERKFDDTNIRLSALAEKDKFSRTLKIIFKKLVLKT